MVLYRCDSKENSLPVELVEASKSGIVRNFQLAAVNQIKLCGNIPAETIFILLLLLLSRRFLGYRVKFL